MFTNGVRSMELWSPPMRTTEGARVHQWEPVHEAMESTNEDRWCREMVMSTNKRQLNNWCLRMKASSGRSTNGGAVQEFAPPIRKSTVSLHPPMRSGHGSD
jgi:hypothetical protein